MEWVIGIVVVLFILGVLLGLIDNGPKEPPRKVPSSTPPAPRRREYASIFENGQYLPLSSEEVAELFGDIRERLKEHRKVAKAMQKLADKFSETGKLDQGAYVAMADAETDARHTLAEAEALNDKLFFESESAQQRYYKFVDDICEAESDIEFAREAIEDTRQAIEDGDFIPEKPIIPKKTKKLPKGS
ncbi:MAG: hypothetical protein WBA29_05440 [Xanthobacteraceae bacterium]